MASKQRKKRNKTIPWCCLNEDCKKRNENTKMCEYCKTPRHPRTERDWTCQCGFVNAESNDICGGNGRRGCKTPKPGCGSQNDTSPDNVNDAAADILVELSGRAGCNTPKLGCG